MQINRSTYSTVNSPVNTHSDVNSTAWYWASIVLTLSRLTLITLSMMATSRATSNALPAGVSASKMISCSRSRQGAIESPFGSRPRIA